MTTQHGPWACSSSPAALAVLAATHVRPRIYLYCVLQYGCTAHPPNTRPACPATPLIPPVQSRIHTPLRPSHALLHYAMHAFFLSCAAHSASRWPAMVSHRAAALNVPRLMNRSMIHTSSLPWAHIFQCIRGRSNATRSTHQSGALQPSGAAPVSERASMRMAI